jgi:hypothetical protein
MKLNYLVIVALVIVALVIVALVAGCTDVSSSAAAPASAQVPAADPPGPVATGTPEQTLTPIKIATAEIDGLYWPYVHEKNGKYYFQPAGFVCTETNPTWVSLGPNWTDQAIWCER